MLSPRKTAWCPAAAAAGGLIICGALWSCQALDRSPPASALRSDAPAGGAPSALNNPWLAENHDVDSDGDGLSDFAEVHKYLTDPQAAKTGGDGIADGDWDKRRRFTYSVRNVLEILKPFDLNAMQSDLQDVRLIEDRGKTAVVEVISYPFNTVRVALTGRMHWREANAASPALASYLAKTFTANWDDAMAADLIQRLKAAGIDGDQMTDVDFVQAVADWIMGGNPTTFPNQAPFVAYVIDFSGHKVALKQGLLPVFQMEPGNADVAPANMQSFLESGILGKTMYDNRARGSCTPTAILFTTIMRALGIPARIILNVPPIDPNDDAQRAFVSGLSNPTVREAIQDGLLGIRGWVGHTFNEVFVGGRWTKLNYNNLGQNNLDAGYFGLLIQVNTLRDWSDVPYADTWGQRVLDDANGQRDPPMSSVNQYRSLGLSDQIGPSCTDPTVLATMKPRAQPGHQTAMLQASDLAASPASVVINEIHWQTDTDLPLWIAGHVQELAPAAPGTTLLIFIDDPAAAGQGYQIYSNFSNSTVATFSLVPDGGGGASVPLKLGPGSSSAAGDASAAFTLIVDPAAPPLVPGVKYRLNIVSTQTDRVWTVPGDLYIQAPPP